MNDRYGSGQKDGCGRIQVVTIAPSWLTLFLDVPERDHEAGRAFWQAATGYKLSLPRGHREEFATLIPRSGDAHLRLQRTQARDFRLHLDLHFSDLDAAVEHAGAVGAELVARPGHATLRSPAGFVFCLVPSHDEQEPAAPGDWDSHRARADQLSIDVAYDAWDREKSFWADLTGWTVTQSSRPEFARLQTPSNLPVRVLLQRLDAGSTSGHLDIASSDRAAEVERLCHLGATPVSSGLVWTVMAGPDRSVFCVTDRDPDTGLLP